MQRITLAGVIAAMTFLAASCGGGGDSNGASVGPAPTTPLAWDSVSATWDQVIWQ